MGMSKLDIVRFHIETEGVYMPHYNQMLASRGGIHESVFVVFRIIQCVFHRDWMYVPDFHWNPGPIVNRP